MKQIFILIFFISNLNFSQQESFLTNFRFQMSLINPSFAGADADNLVALTSRNQWASIENSPKTQVLTFSSKRKKNVGLGISIMSNNYFVEKNTASYLDFSYKLNLSENSLLYLGLKGGATFYKANLIGLTTLNSAPDPAQSSFARFNPNLGIGTYLQTPSFWFSFSIPRLFNSGDTLSFTITSTDQVHTYFASGVIFKINDSFDLKPSILVRSVSNFNTTADFLTLLSYKNLFDIGASYRTTNSLGIISYVSIKKFLDFGYSYEASTLSGLSGLNVKTHEISIRFRFNSSTDTGGSDEIE